MLLNNTSKLGFSIEHVQLVRVVDCESRVYIVVRVYMYMHSTIVTQTVIHVFKYAGLKLYYNSQVDSFQGALF